mgnify:CR=1 FL=1|tara:strand:+ start:199 stop:471 length:273 start_codon:yes stop_codon:yes gene_type:complete
MPLLGLFENTGSLFNKLSGNPPHVSLLKDTIPINDSFSKGKYLNYFMDFDNLPFPSGGSQNPSPPSPQISFLLQENNSYLLQEDESYLIS